MELSYEEIDENLLGPIQQLVDDLEELGRSARQALQDIRRLVNALETELDQEEFSD